MAISPDLAARYLGNPDQLYDIEAISLSHPALAEDLHYTNASFPIIGLLDNALPGTAEFRPLPFSTTMPSKNTEGSQSLQFSVSNVTAELVAAIAIIESAPQSPLTLLYRVYMSTQKNVDGAYINQRTPPWRFEVSNIATTAEAATFSATKINIHNRSYPRARYTRTRFPALDR
jgi:hypothetical protein